MAVLPPFDARTRSLYPSAPKVHVGGGLRRAGQIAFVMLDDAGWCPPLVRRLIDHGYGQPCAWESAGVAQAAGLLCCVRHPSEAQILMLCERGGLRADQALLIVSQAPVSVRVQWLRAGVDDLLTPDCAPSELLARMDLRVMQRRRMVTRWSYGDLRFDPDERRAWWRGQGLTLSPREWALLHQLALAQGQTMHIAELRARVWHQHHDPGTNSVAVHILRLRRELTRFGAGRLIETVRGQGYRLVLMNADGDAG